MGSREGVKCQKEQYVKILLHKRDGYMKKQTCKIAMLNENGFMKMDLESLNLLSIVGSRK